MAKSVNASLAAYHRGPEPITLDTLVSTAVNNLADHCEAVLAAHGWPSKRTESLWMNRHTLLIPYPQVITLGLSNDEESLFDEIESFIRSRPAGTPLGINESFSRLDLDRFGLKRLFSSSLSVRQPGTLKVEVPHQLEIVPIETPGQLIDFDRANSTGFGSPDAVRVYLDPLLEDARFRIYAGVRDGRVVSGAMAFNNGVMVGVYALSTLPEARNKGFGEAVVRSLLKDSPDLPAMTHPSGMSNGLFSRLRFEAYGRQTVWVTSEES